VAFRNDAIDGLGCYYVSRNYGSGYWMATGRIASGLGMERTSAKSYAEYDYIIVIPPAPLFGKAFHLDLGLPAEEAADYFVYRRLTCSHWGAVLIAMFATAALIFLRSRKRVASAALPLEPA
jgi:hypothetical protein